MERTTTPAPGDGGGGSGESTGGAFTRKASGLVREFSQLDAWIYNVLALNLVVLIALAYVAAAATFPQASIWLAVVICGVFCTFEAIAYAFFLTIMPRSGGDYVFQSRILGGGVASVFVFTAIVLAQTVLVALTAYLGATLVLSPFFLLLGAEYDWQWLIDAGDWIATQDGIFIISAVYIVWCGLINILGLRLYTLIQRYVFWLGMACVAIVLVMLLFTSHDDFVNNLNGFMSENYDVDNAYQTVIDLGGTADTSFSLSGTILAAVFFSLFLAFPHWGVMQGGEIKRAGSLRSNIYSIAGAEVFSFVDDRDLRRAAGQHRQLGVPVRERRAVLRRLAGQPVAGTAVLRLLRRARVGIAGVHMDRVHHVLLLVHHAGAERAPRGDSSDGRDVVRPRPARVVRQGQSAFAHAGELDHRLHVDLYRGRGAVRLRGELRAADVRARDPEPDRIRADDGRGDVVPEAAAGDVPVDGCGSDTASAASR